MLTDHPELFDGMRLVPCAVMTDNDNPQAGWLFIPHADGKWVSAAKLQPFSQQIINYWWNRPSSAEVSAEAQPVCKCSMRIKMVGDGCAVCNPDLAAEIRADNERDALQAKVAELELYVGNLLARIHRDGGHYQAEHGNLKAVRDADIIVAKLNAQSDEQSAEIERQNRAYEAQDEARSRDFETIAQQAALIEKCGKLLRRYFNETPIGHQPHMIAEPAHDLLAAIATQKS